MSILSKIPIFRRFSLSALLANYLLGSLTDHFLSIETQALLKTSDVWPKRMFGRNFITKRDNFSHGGITYALSLLSKE